MIRLMQIISRQGAQTLILIILAMALMLTAAGCSAQAAPAGPPPTFDTGIDPNAWATIPEGEFLMGLNNNETRLEHSFEMMLTDVTNAQFADFLNNGLADDALKMGDEGVMGYYPGDKFTGHKHEREIKEGDWLLFPVGHPDARIQQESGEFVVKPGYENHPATMVTWFGARAYCEYYGWRLPLEVEWEKAARGEDGRAFPWGDEIAKNNANFYKSGDPFEQPGQVGDTTPVGFYNGKVYNGYQTMNSPSPYGLYDMAGNVWQWTGGVYEATHLRYLKGGSFMDYDYNLRSWTRNSASPDHYSISIGFRCAR